MKGLMEIKEFDKICCNPSYDGEYKYLCKPVFEELRAFIHSFTSDEEHADALEFLKIGFRRNVGDIISVNNYVGVIQIQNGYQIQVLPKIDLGIKTDRENETTKRVFLRMLRSMKDFPGKVLNDANLKTDRMNLYEIFINMYLQEVHALVKHGLKSSYVSLEENLKFYKGKMNVNEQIKRNTAHGERFFVRYDEYQIDRAENRLIKATLLKLHSITESAENQKEIRHLLVAFDAVKSSVNYQKDFARVVIDRNMKNYEKLIQWSKVFLLNKSFTTFSGGHNARALLFPMERVFESFVAKQLKRELQDLNWEVSTQDKGYYLFDFPRQFALRPDIVITRDDGSRVVLDTKWKTLTDNRRINYGISQTDMYQMYVYSKKYDTSDIWLLYPVNEEMRNQQDISFKSQDGVNVRVFFIDVADIENSIKTLREKIKNSEWV